MLLLWNLIEIDSKITHILLNILSKEYNLASILMHYVFSYLDSLSASLFPKLEKLN